MATADAQAQRRTKIDALLQRQAAFGDQVVAGVAGARICVLGCTGLLCGQQRLFGNFQFAAATATGQLLDGAAVLVAGGKIHRGKIAACAQAGIHQADVLEQLRPVDGGNQAHAVDDVAYRKVGRALALLRMLHHFIDAAALRAEALFQPAQCRGGERVMVTQALGQLCGKRLAQRGAGALVQFPVERRVRGVFTQQAAGQCVGIGPRAAPGGHLVGQATQVFDQHDAQGDGHCPQLADGQRLDLLIGDDKALQDVRVEVAVGVGDKRPGHAQYPWITGKGTAGEFRQLAVIARRQVIADLANLLFDQVIVVQQPLGCRYHATAVGQFRSTGAVGRKQYLGVVVQPAMQGQHGGRLAADSLGGGQGVGVLFEAFDAEQFFAYRGVIKPWRGCSGMAE